MSSSSSSSSTTTSPYTEQQYNDAVARAKQEARRDGAFAGLSAALTGAVIGSKLFKLNKYRTIFCGALTGVLAGYQFFQGFISTNMARLEAEQARFRKNALQSHHQSSSEFDSH